MENDSLQVLPDSGAVAPVENDENNQNIENADSAPEMQMPTAEQLGISISAGVKSGEIHGLTATVGDTIDFPVTISWSVNGSALLVVPANRATAKGLEQVGISQESSRTLKDGKEIASITFTYKIAVQDTGNLNVPVLKYEIPTPLGRPLELRTESVPLQSDAPACWTPAIVGCVVALAVLFAGVWRMRRRAASRKALRARETADNLLKEKMMVLKQRVSAADSRQWLLELESICKEFAAARIKPSGEDANREVNLDALLKSGALEKWGSKEGWHTLLEEFAHARYGGGKRDAFENKETWKLAMKLMDVEEE
ncbi:MAG: hypothetical protein HUK20_05440 [Fibrobacter sp.]|nr:hypothetical protein [Fibrobacter sp.]